MSGFYTHVHMCECVHTHTLGLVHTLKGCGSCVVVYEVFDTLVCGPLLPTQWEGQLVRHGETRVLPLCCLALVVHEVYTAVR